MLPAKQEEALFAFFDACSLLWRKTIHTTDLPSLEQQLNLSLHQLEMAFPCSIARITLHNMTHLVDKIRLVGPLYITSMFPYERSYRLMRSWITNQAHVEASLAKNIRANSMMVLYTADHSAGVTSSMFDIPNSSSTDAAANNMSAFVSPFEVQPDGNWVVETSAGRLKKKAIMLVRVKEGHPDYLLLHLHHYESTAAYREAFNRYKGSCGCC